MKTPRVNPHTQRLTKRKAALQASSLPAPKLQRAVERDEKLAKRWSDRQALTPTPNTARAKLRRGDDLAALEDNLTKVKSKPRPVIAAPDPSKNRFALLAPPRLTEAEKQKRAEAKRHTERWNAARANRPTRDREAEHAARQKGFREHLEKERAAQQKVRREQLEAQLGAVPSAGRLSEIAKIKVLIAADELSAAAQRITALQQAVNQERLLAQAQGTYDKLVRDEAALAKEVGQLVDDADADPTFHNKRKLKSQRQALVQASFRAQPARELVPLQEAARELSNRIEEWRLLKEQHDESKAQGGGRVAAARPPLPPLAGFVSIHNHTSGTFTVGARVDWNEVYDNSSHGKKIAVNPSSRAAFLAAMNNGYIASTSTGESGVKKEPNLWVVKISIPDATAAGLNNAISLIARSKDPTSTGGDLRLTFTSAELRH